MLLTDVLTWEGGVLICFCSGTIGTAGPIFETYPATASTLYKFLCFQATFLGCWSIAGFDDKRVWKSPAADPIVLPIMSVVILKNLEIYPFGK